MEIDLEEVLRYLGSQSGGPAREAAQADLRERAARCAKTLSERITPRFTYRVFPLARGEGGIELPGSGLSLTGTLVQRMLADSERAVLLLCTLGPEFDALLRREQVRDMADAVILDACGSAWVEAGCDEAEREISARFPELYRTDRFSPGYGDLPLSVQAPLCRALDAQRRLGVTVGESYLLNPGKSVTAVLGLSRLEQKARIRGCAYCALRERCAMRKRGQSCEG